MLVAAVLAPQRAEQPQFQFVRLASEPLHDQVVLAAPQRNLVQRFLRHGHQFTAPMTPTPATTSAAPNTTRGVSRS